MPWREPLLAAYVSSFESRLFSSSSHLLTGELGVWCLCGNPCIFDLSLCQMCGGRGFRPLRGLSLGLAVISFTVQKLPDFMESWDISWAVGGLCRESLPEFTLWSVFPPTPPCPFPGSTCCSPQPAACLVLFCGPLAVLISFAFCLAHRPVAATGTQKALSSHEQMTGWVDGGG